MHIKKWLESQLFDAVKEWLPAQAAEIYEEGICELVKAYKKTACA